MFVQEENSNWSKKWNIKIHETHETNEIHETNAKYIKFILLLHRN